MLSVADSVCHFWFSDDTEFQSQDPHAYWLINRMMQMVQLIETALTNWRELREQIAQILPKKKQKSCREIIKQIHTRLYDDLQNLKEIRY